MRHISIRYCNCKNTFQDREYGIGLRLSNFSKKQQEWTCSCCGNVTSYYKNDQDAMDALQLTFNGQFKISSANDTN